LLHSCAHAYQANPRILRACLCTHTHSLGTLPVPLCVSRARLLASCIRHIHSSARTLLTILAHTSHLSTLYLRTLLTSLLSTYAHFSPLYSLPTHTSHLTLYPLTLLTSHSIRSHFSPHTLSALSGDYPLVMEATAKSRPVFARKLSSSTSGSTSSFLYIYFRAASQQWVVGAVLGGSSFLLRSKRTRAPLPLTGE
jgi:hypothetical protein